MPSTLENPFTPKKDLPTKRLFGGEEKRRELGAKATKRIQETKEKVTKVKYGELEILKPQAEFLYEMEKELRDIAKEKGEELSKKAAIEKLVYRIEVDKSGNIEKIDFEKMELKKLPNLDKLTKLQKLNCSDNRCLELLPNLDKLANLQNLTCVNNQLTSLPNLDKLVNLEYLVCIRNQLTSLPDLDKLVKLKLLALMGNPLTEKAIKKIKSQVPENCHVEI